MRQRRPVAAATAAGAETRSSTASIAPAAPATQAGALAPAPDGALDLPQRIAGCADPAALGRLIGAAPDRSDWETMIAARIALREIAAADIAALAGGWPQ